MHSHGESLDKITQFVKRHFSSWQSGLETILEQEPSLNLEKLSLSFETSTDISHLESTLDFLPLDEADRIIHIFSRLSPILMAAYCFNSIPQSLRARRNLGRPRPCSEKVNTIH